MSELGRGRVEGCEVGWDKFSMGGCCKGTENKTV